MRWRDIKQNRIKSNKQENAVAKSANISKRLKAFLVDMFMIAMPILYITTYFILDGKEDFRQNQIAIFLCNMLFGFILSLFLSSSSQTPGYKAYNIKLTNAKTGDKVGFFRCFWRFLCFALSGLTVIGLFVCFFRKDGKTLHDILSQTIVLDA